MYVPARVAQRKGAFLGDLPIPDHSRFTFIDLGSGKGRILFLAAEYPYRRIQGVEFARELHSEAQENFRTFSTGAGSSGAGKIESVCVDAGNFEFPKGNLW